MRGRTFILVNCAAALLTAGTGRAQGPSPFPQEEVLVIVWNEAGRCSVLERRTSCARVAGLLTGVLQIGRDRHIVVAAQSEMSDVQVRAAQVMADIKAAGYRSVRPALNGR